ncbi:MAG: hypothetical protein NTZ73_04575 [Candidatus Diapherotrites archaeon]|nr:hypothetical protein [Candidatus Diapherotrites archaeon]
MEKKLKPNQKLALERIYRLFELAEEDNTKRKGKYSKRYLKLMVEIGKKVNVPVPKELKKKFCKKCFSLNVDGREEKPFLIVKCGECGFEKKFSA